MGVHDRLSDEVSDGLIGEMAFDFIPGSDQTAGAFELQVHEGAQRTEDVVADGVLPTHEEPLGMAELLEGTMERTRCPSAGDARGEKSPGPLPFAFFFVGRTVRSASRRGFYRPFETPSDARSPHPAVRPRGKPCNAPPCIWPSRVCSAYAWSKRPIWPRTTPPQASQCVSSD